MEESVTCRLHDLSLRPSAATRPMVGFKSWSSVLCRGLQRRRVQYHVSGTATPWSPPRGSGGSRNLNTRSTERRTARDGKRRQAIPIPYGALTGRGSGYGRQGLTALRPVIVPLPGRRTVRTTHRTPRTMGFICYAPLS